ncbi:MAG: ABC transporter permease subunit [Acidobacteria bacterium]|nr:ABC transporter permease subunit [Acidobacteriota bacterium]MCI0664978.1 ABC transporter permease subunit [Acidobacteriota bacterium]
MKGILAIYRREMSSYFVSPIAYIVIGFFLVVTGYFFSNILAILIERSFMAQMQAQRFGAPPEMDVPSMVIRNFIGVIATVMLFLIPMMTMGVYAEERKRGTMEMLMTSPISEIQIVIGKYLASLTLFILMLAPTLLYYLVMSRYSEPAMPWRIVWAGYLGIFLLGALLIAIGSFISALTESQIIAGVVTFVIFLLLWVIDLGARGASTTTGEIFKYLSVLQHYDSFSQGVIDTSSIIFYVSLSIFGIFLTLRTLDSMRWRRA